MCNVYNRPNGRRTKNEVEGFHSKINRYFETPNQYLWTFTAHMRKLQAYYNLYEHQFINAQTNLRKP